MQREQISVASVSAHEFLWVFCFQTLCFIPILICWSKQLRHLSIPRFAPFRLATSISKGDDVAAARLMTNNYRSYWISWYNRWKLARAAKHIRVIMRLQHYAERVCLSGLVCERFSGGKCNFLNAESYTRKRWNWLCFTCRSIKAKESERYTISFSFADQRSNQTNEEEIFALA